MPYYILTSLKAVEGALDLLTTAHGAYTAVDILKGALADVDEPRELDAQLSKTELQQFASYEGPADAERTILKAVKTAAHSDIEKQNPLLELVALVLVRLGVAKGSKVLSLLLVACGFDPTLALVVIKVCVLLARTETGRKIVAAAAPRIKDAIPVGADRVQLAESLKQLVASMGERGADLLQEVKSSAGVARRSAQTSATAIDELLDQLEQTSSDNQQT